MPSLELLALVHAHKALRPYLIYKPFELHTYNASLQWLPCCCNGNATLLTTRRVGSTCWPNISANPEPHQSGRLPHPDALLRRPEPALHTGYEDSELKHLPRLARPPLPLSWQLVPLPSRLLYVDFAAAVRATLTSDPVLGPLTAAAQAQAPPRLARRAAPPSVATGCYFSAAGAAMDLA